MLRGFFWVNGGFCRCFVGVSRGFLGVSWVSQSSVGYVRGFMDFSQGFLGVSQISWESCGGLRRFYAGFADIS